MYPAVRKIFHITRQTEFNRLLLGGTPEKDSLNLPGYVNLNPYLIHTCNVSTGS
jgi:hypothetical protein